MFLQSMIYRPETFCQRKFKEQQKLCFLLGEIDLQRLCWNTSTKWKHFNITTIPCTGNLQKCFVCIKAILQRFLFILYIMCSMYKCAHNSQSCICAQIYNQALKNRTENGRAQIEKRSEGWEGRRRDTLISDHIIRGISRPHICMHRLS